MQVFFILQDTVRPTEHHLAALHASRHWILAWAAGRTVPFDLAARVRVLARSFDLASRVRAVACGMTPATVTVLSAFTNILLSAFKLLVGSLSGSAALVADGAHSLSDLISDAVCLATTGRAEHVGELGISGMLLATGGAMTVHSGRALLEAVGPAAAAAPLAALELAPLLVAFASIASKELLFRLTYQVGMRCDSPVTVANAYHQRSDALASIVAFVGIGGAMAGWGWLDPLAATAVGVMVSMMGVEVARESIGAIASARATAGHPRSQQISVPS